MAVGAASDPLGSIAYYDGALAGVPEAFGEGAGVSDVRHGWAGMETLPGTPYQLAQHRLYDTANGRFTTADPIGLAGGDHRYAYGGGDPVQFVDPSGLAYAAPGSTALGVGQTYDGLHTKQLFDSMVTGMGENSGYDQWHDPGTYEDFFSADALHDPQYRVGGPAPDECQGMGCMPACGEPGDEQDGTGIFRESVPVLSADGQERGMTWRERREARREARGNKRTLGQIVKDWLEGWDEWVYEAPPAVVPEEGTPAWFAGRNADVIHHPGLLATLVGGGSGSRAGDGGGDPLYEFIDAGSRRVTAGALGTVAGATRFAGLSTRAIVHDALAPVLVVQDLASRAGLNDESYLESATGGIEPPFNALAQQMETTAESLDPDWASWAGTVALTGLQIAAVLEGEGTGASEGAASRILQRTPRSLQKGFTKHGAHFGLEGNWNPGRAADFSRAVHQHINDPAVRAIEGTYRGDPVTHFLNPETGVNVMADPAGNYVSGWMIEGEQLESVLTTGRLY